ncbi:probable inactive receptor kinase At1g27190 [Triticum urartu]|uniref:probable inactive receptor kinase At1g27190 n=1 Tax=Triticum urartu TaxID=4572 RepID=UPI000356DBCD|nr:probable inactive receptor kinase At1g27190 [Triticum urartu]
MVPEDTKLLLWLVLISTGSLSACCGSSNNDIRCLMAVQQLLNNPQGTPNDSPASDSAAAGDTSSGQGAERWTSGAVMSLHLGSMGLKGQFPQGLEFCTSLTGLDLSGNGLSGPIPRDISRQLPYVTYLDLSNNSFSGEIPGSVSGMAYLNVLNLERNQLRGQIPEQIGHLARLTSINVADNLLSGPVPGSLRSFPAANFTGNQGLCGEPLRYCERRQGGDDGAAVGVAVGFVVGFVVALYFPRLFVFCGKLQPYMFRV